MNIDTSSYMPMPHGNTTWANALGNASEPVQVQPNRHERRKQAAKRKAVQKKWAAVRKAMAKGRRL